MKISRRTSVSCSILMSAVMSHVPNVAAAEVNARPSQGMVSTQVVLNEMTRQEAEQKVRNYLSKEEVRQVMLKQGVNADEVSQRLAALSETELRQLAGQIDKAQYGGDILFAVLIVVLIIFLIQRI